MVSGEQVNTVANSLTMLALEVTTLQSNAMSSMTQVIINYNEIITPMGNKSKMLRVIYKSKKLTSKFQIKDKTKFKHMHNIVYHGKCHNKSCNSHYGGQTKC